LFPIIAQVAFGISVFGIALWLDDASENESHTERAPSEDPEFPESPWVRDEVRDDRGIRSSFSHRGWFTVTDVARELQGRGGNCKPSGSANRDAHELIGRWLSEGKLEKRNVRSGRPLYQLKSSSV
jgi:hypothetical protein